jgi:hypothetical protein
MTPYEQILQNRVDYLLIDIENETIRKILKETID